jgi:hypothetical protein
MFKNHLLLLLIVYMLCCNNFLGAQTQTSSVCNTAVGICSSSTYSFPAGVNAGTAATGPNYGCLTTQPNPAWFFLQMKNSGTIKFTMTSSPLKDIDYIVWGPFTSPSAPCSGGLTSGKIVSCSYSNASTETATITNGVSGNYYILLITNFSNTSTNITFSQTSGTGSSNCDILCNITGLTATASACQTGAGLGTYAVTGTVTTFMPADSGSLTISSSCGASVSYTAPFATSINYALPNTAGHGDSCTITAVFSKVTSCTRSTSIATPTCCSVSAPSTATVCESQNLSLSASSSSGGTYTWTGPGSFSASVQNPVRSNISLSHAGIYQVAVTNGSCTTPPTNVTVTVKAKPASKNISHR